MELNDRLKKSKGYEILNKINQFNFTRYIFDNNFKDLEIHIKKLMDPNTASRFQKSSNRQENDSLQLEILRYLHNFIASAISLIDHTRIFINDLYKETDPFYKEYCEKVNEDFKENPLAAFIKDLRQYIQHYQTPIIAFVSNITDDINKLNAKIVIEKSALLKFSGWNARSKKYINEIEKDLDILIVTKQYHTLVSTFYDWLQRRQKEIYKNEFNEFDKLRKQLYAVNLEEIVLRFIKSENYSKESFISEFQSFLGDTEKKYFNNVSQELQIEFVLGGIELNNIKLKFEQIQRFKKKYIR
jgi:hypothetical protein